MIGIMEPSSFLLLLNDRLKKDLLSFSHKEKMRIFEKLSYLENGMWDTGVKVKKLKGASNKVIFEARINKGDRLIFTLGRDGRRTCIYIWALIHHDAISKKAHTILPDNAPFLHFDALSEETMEELIIDSLHEEAFSQESIEQKVLEDYGPQKWMNIGDTELQRFLGNNNPDFFELFLYLTDEQQDVLALPPPILLSGTAGSGKTTLAVYYLLKGTYSTDRVLFVTCSQFLKEYSQKLYKGLTIHSSLEEKSGKVDFYMLKELILEILEAKGIYPDLKNEVDLKGFIEIFNRHSLSKKYDAELVWEEIRSIIKGANPPVSLRHYQFLITRYLNNTLTPSQLRQLKDSLLALKNYDFSKKFERIIEKKSSLVDFTNFVQHLNLPNQQSSYETYSFILSEILRILKTKETHLSSPLLSLEEYSTLGKKRAPNFLYDREEIYSIALYYQQQLEVEKKFDEIDLCRKAIIALEQLEDRFRWDLVVSDEVQDFSDIQLTLLFKLSKKPGDVVCLGDPKQIINPSGFRWEELKSRFYEQGIVVPEVHHLHLNFRCVGSIVKLSNALLKLKQHLVGISGYEKMEEWKFNGRPPYLIHGLSEVNMAKEVASTAANQVILVRSESEKRKLIKSLKTELVFTIHEAKGLEFETVLLWKFSSDAKSSDIWRKIYGENYLSESHNPLIKHEINLLYVAVTRARNTLIIYDGAYPSPVWHIETLAPHIFSTKEKDALSQVWRRISSRSEWDEQGNYFFEREYYLVAAECYHNSSNDAMYDVSMAYIKRSENLHLVAAELFMKRGKKAEAAIDYEIAGEYKKALVLWKQLKRKDRIILTQIYVLESEKKYIEAASLWVKQKRFDRAVENWEKGKAYSKLAHHYFKLKSYILAGENYEKAGLFEEAALCYTRLKQFKKAATLYVQSKAYDKAIPLYKKVKDWDKVIECYRVLEDYYQLGILYEKRKEYSLAIEAFTLYSHELKKNTSQLLEEAKSGKENSRTMLKAAVRYASSNKHNEAASLFFKKKRYDLALSEYLRADDKASAAMCYTLLDKIEQAIDLYEEIDDTESHYKVIDILRSTMRKGWRFDQYLAQECYEEGESLYRKGEYSKALTRYMAVNEPNGALKSAIRTEKRDEEVLNYFKAVEEYEKGIEFIGKKKNLVVSNTFLENFITTKEQRMVSELVSEQEERLVLELISKLYTQKTPYDLIPLIQTYLATFDFFYQVERTPKIFFDLIINTRYLNHIVEIVRKHGTSDKACIDQFKKQLASSNDPLLIALSKETLPSSLDPLLQEIEIDMHNYELFTLSFTRKIEALNYLKKHCTDYSKIINFCIDNDLYKEAALLYEKEGKHKRAAEIFYEDGYFSDALRCYKKINNIPGIAKTYEAMHRYEEALLAYTTLGKETSIKRMKKKLQKKEYIQKELF